MKKTIIFLFFPLQIYCQQWYQMGNLDTIGNINGQKGVAEITFYNGKITIGGNFKKENSTILNAIAQWSGNSWLPMGIGVWATTAVDSIGNGGGGLVGYKNKFYSAGSFIGAGGNYIGEINHTAGRIAKWDGLDWNPLSGLYPPASGFDGNCLALCVYKNNLYAAGGFSTSFDNTGTINTQGISKWNDTVFSAVGQMAGDFPPYYDFGVFDLCTYNNKLIACGEFTSIDGSAYGTFSGIAAWNDSAWSPLGVGFNNTVVSLTVFNGVLYAGGTFTATRDNLTPLNHIAKWNGIQWSAVGEGLNDTVWTLTVDSVNNKIYAGGSFTQTGLGVPAKHIAEWTGSNWQEVGGGVNRRVGALFANDSNLYVGGEFTKAGNIQASLIAVWGHSPIGLSVGQGVEMNNETLTISPNPTTSLFTIHSEGMIIKEIKIYNLIGEQIKTITNTTTVDLIDTPNGIYFAEIKTDKGTTNKKIILQ